MWNCFIVGLRSNVSELENKVKEMQGKVENMQISPDEIKNISEHFTERLTVILDKYSVDKRSKNYFSQDIEDYITSIIASVDEAVKQ